MYSSISPSKMMQLLYIFPCLVIAVVQAKVKIAALPSVLSIEKNHITGISGDSEVETSISSPGLRSTHTHIPMHSCFFLCFLSFPASCIFIEYNILQPTNLSVMFSVMIVFVPTSPRRVTSTSLCTVLPF